MDKRGIPKVSWTIYTMAKEAGGLGLINLQTLADKLAAKWILRSMDSDEFWAVLLRRNIHKFSLKSYKAWSGLSAREVLLSASWII